MQNRSEGTNESGRGLTAGRKLGKYRIVEPLGSGGRGTVYRAKDTELQRDVALKILTNTDDFGAYLDEARAAAQISHPNIVTVHDAGLIDDQPYIAMELVTGCRLDELLKDGPLPTDKALDLICQLLLGLQATHRAGIIHCDIKPSNIAIDERGCLRLLDFGIASSKPIPKGEADLITGTIAYMAPEQLSGSSLTPAADMYAVGALLFEMLTGELPITADYEAALIYSIINQSPKELSEHLPGIPVKLSQIVSHLLSKQPASRYQSASELLTELDQLTEKKQCLSKVKSAKPTAKAVVVVAAILITVSSLVLFKLFSKSTPTENKDSTLRLAVLPFENRGEAEDDYFVNGVTDAITVQLWRLQGLKVINGSRVTQLKTKSVDSKNIGEKLGADYLLTGKVYLLNSAQGNQVRVDAVLTEVSENTYLWGESYVYEKADLFTLQTNIAKQVCNALSVRVTDQSFTGQIPTSNLEAYDFYLRGNEYFYKSWGQKDLLNAVQMYSRAIELDSTFALAQAMLSRGHESIYWEYIDRIPARCSLALASAERALAIDPNLPEAKLALAYFYYHCEQDYPRALSEFQAVLEDLPNSSDLHSALGAVMRRFPGELAKATLHFKTAADLDPASHLKAFDVGLTYCMSREYDSAMIYFDRALMLEPGWGLTYVILAWTHIYKNGDIEKAKATLKRAIGHADLTDSRYYWWLARITETDYNEVLNQTRPGADTSGYYLHRATLYSMMGNKTEENRLSDSARIILEQLVLVNPGDPRYLSHLGLAYARLGERELALKFANQAAELLPTSQDAFDGLFILFEKAETFMVLGMENKAIEIFRYMLSIQGFMTPSFLRVDPLWQPLKDNPKFMQLLKITDNSEL